MSFGSKRRRATRPRSAALRPLRMLIFFCVLTSLVRSAFAHEIRPAYLEIRETGPDTCDILWNVPARDELRLGLYVGLPEDCIAVGEPRTALAREAFTERWSIRRVGGLAGATIDVAGLAAAQTDVLVRVERLGGGSQVERLTPERASFVVEAAPGAWRVATTYLVLGFEHILLGIDHLLFVLALLVLVRGWRRLVGTITAFTLAHSLTLAAATLGFVDVPGPPVEAVIALSIVFVACEILNRHQGRMGLAERSPWIVAFVFGLLHGFGFAGALSEVGLPPNSIPLALLLFNVGVEAGQLAFIAALLCAYRGFRRVVRGPEAHSADRVQVPAAWEPVVAYGIGAVACWWLVERVTQLGV